MAGLFAVELAGHGVHILLETNKNLRGPCVSLLWELLVPSPVADNFGTNFIRKLRLKSSSTQCGNVFRKRVFP